MYKGYKLIAGVLLAGGVLAGCGNAAEEPEENKTEQEETAGNENEEKEQNQEQSFSVGESETGIQVATYQDMMANLVKAKEDKEVDWDKVDSLYKENLQASVNEINGDYDQAIQAGIAAGKSGDLDPKVALQLVDKVTQSYFYQKQKSLHSDVATALEAGDTDKATQTFEELKHVLNEVIIPTAEKRDNYYELTGESSIAENIKNGITVQEEALKAGNVDDFSVFKQITDKSVYRSYYLAANSYAEKVAKAVSEGNTDETELKIMQAEGWGFLQAISGSLSGGSEEAATELNTIFSLDQTEPTAIDADQVSKLFTEAFVGKIKGYHEKAPAALEEGDVTKARVQAMEANVFMKAIELVMVEKLGEEKAKETFENGQKWYEAIASEDQEAVAEWSETIITTLDEVTK